MIENNQNVEKYNYQLYESQISQDQWCGAIAINKGNSFVLIGYKLATRGFAFKNGALHKANYIISHSDYVTSLNLLKKKPFFISGSSDANIVIMSTNLMANPKYIQKLKGHTERIYSIVVSPVNEEMIISCSKDCQIKFWAILSNKQKKSCQQTVSDHKNQVLKISINELGNKLISIGLDKLILILTKEDSYWVIQQKIQVDKVGPNVHFLTNDIFIFQPRAFFPNQQKTENFLIYMFDQNTQLFQKMKEIIISEDCQNCIGSFPIFYNYQKSLLIFQNGSNLKMIRFLNIEQGEFKSEQIIPLTNQEKINPLSFISGIVSEDWRYLLVWDKSSFTIQVRMCHQFM